jgi:hypothetical protein
MSERLPLPHRPYVDAVVAALGDLAAEGAVVSCQRSEGSGPTTMAALIALDDEEHDEEIGRTVRTQLHWSQLRGWEYAYKCSDTDEVRPESLLSGVVPLPATIADAARLASEARAEDLPLLAAETAAHSGQMSPALAQAVHDQDLMPEVAARLAAYGASHREALDVESPTGSAGGNSSK